MKHLSDYTGEESFDLWMDIFEYLAEIFGDEKVQQLNKSNENIFVAVRSLLKTHEKAVKSIIFKFAEPEEITGSTLIPITIEIFTEIMRDGNFVNFFSLSAKKDNKSSGGATANTTAEKA